MKGTCRKCNLQFDRNTLCRIHLNTSNDVYLCPACMETWSKIYNKWKRSGKTDFWNRGWSAFLKEESKRKFNPSIRGSA